MAKTARDWAIDAHNYLLPAICDRREPGITINSWVSEHDNILVTAKNEANGLELGFAITSAAIVDGLCTSQFKPSMDALMHHVKTGMPADPRYHSPTSENKETSTSPKS